MITQPLCIIAGNSTCMVVCPPSPEATESEDGGGSTGAPEWQLLDWDDYDFPEDAGGAGGGGCAADPLAAMLEGLPGFAEQYSITCSGSYSRNDSRQGNSIPCNIS